MPNTKHNPYKIIHKHIYQLTIIIYLCTLLGHKSDRFLFWFRNILALLAVIQSGKKVNFTQYLVRFLVFFLLNIASLLWTTSTEYSFVGITELLDATVALMFIHIYVISYKDADFILNSLLLSTAYMTVRLLINYQATIGYGAANFGLYVIGYHYNHTAQFLSFAVIIATYLSYKKSGWYFALLPLYLFIIVLCTSRKALAIALVGFITIVILNNGVKRILVTVGIVFFTLIVAIVIVNRYTSYFSRMFNIIYIITGHGGEDASLDERIYLASVAIEMIRKKPLLGYGINTFTPYLGKVYIREMYSHNNYLEIASGIGIVGSVLYYYAHFKNLNKVIKSPHSFSIFSLPIILLVSIVFLDLMTVSYYFPFYQILLYLSDYMINERSVVSLKNHSGILTKHIHSFTYQSLL